VGAEVRAERVAAVFVACGGEDSGHLQIGRPARAGSVAGVNYQHDRDDDGHDQAESSDGAGHQVTD
jgi:hypothetical protein